MHRRLVFALGSLIALSVLGLAGLGVVAALDRAQMEQLTRRELLAARLDALRTQVGQVVETQVADVSNAMLRVPDSTDDRRAFRHGLVRQLFATDKEGRVLFPPSENASKSERDFLRRTAAIWSGQALLRADEPAEIEAADGLQVLDALGSNSSGLSNALKETNKTLKNPLKRRARQSSVSNQDDPPPQRQQAQVAEPAQQVQQVQAPQVANQAIVEQAALTNAVQKAAPVAQGEGTLMHLARRKDSGIVAWFWQEGLHLLFWRLTESGTIQGAELDRVALVARLVAAIEPEVGDGMVELLDDRGRVVAGWGSKTSKVARLVRPLPTPLHAFSLAYRPTKAEWDRGGLPVGALGGLAAFVLMLGGLGVWIVRESNRELREASERVTFVTQVSHELKTPLTNIRLYAELLDRRLEDDPPAQDKLHVIGAESRRLGRLVDNILAFARVRRGTLSLEPSEVELAPVLERITLQFGPSLQAREIRVEQSGEAPLAVQGDVDAIEQVLSNLIGNVEKYAASGQVVLIELEQDELRTKIRVGDRGPGVPAAARQRIFEPFYRASGQLSDGVTGTGIGLSIARTLARRLGGELRLLERGPGAWFELELKTKEAA